MGRLGEDPPPDTITCAQVHGDGVLRFEGHPPALSGREGDAIVTAVPGACVGVRTADCLPILIVGPGGKVVAAVHAGWRGTVAGVATATLACLADRFDLGPDELTVRFGPCIRPCCYRVGDELIDRVRETFPRWAGMVLTDRPDGTRFDLAALNRLQLESLGVHAIHDDGECTSCHPDRYESYRRDGQSSGRMVSWVRAAS